MPYEIIYKGQSIEFPNESAAVSFLKAAQQTSTKKESSPAPSPSPTPTSTADLTPPTAAEPTTGAFDRLTAAAKVALSPSSQAQIGPATSPVRETQTTTATEALNQTPILPGILAAPRIAAVGPIAGLVNAAQTGRALLASPGQASATSDYKTKEAMLVEASQFRSDVTPERLISDLVTNGYLNKTTENRFKKLGKLPGGKFLQEELTDVTNYLMPLAGLSSKVGIKALTKSAKVIEEGVESALKQADAPVKQAVGPAEEAFLKTLKKADDVVKKEMEQLPLFQTVEKLTSGNGALPPLKALPGQDAKVVGNFKLNLANWFESGERTLKRFGEPGKKFLEKLNRADFKSKSELGAFQENLNKYVKPLTPLESENLVDVAQGNAPAINDRVSKAFKEFWAPYREEWADFYRLKNKQVKIVENYFPHFRPKETIDAVYAKKGEAFRAKVKELLRSGAAADEWGSIKLALREGDPTRIGGRSIMSEFDRTMAGGEYSKDAYTVLNKAAENFYRRAAEIEEYGIADGKMQHLINEVGKQYGPNAEAYTREIFKQVIGDNALIPKYKKTIHQGLRSYEATTKLGYAFLINPAQVSNNLVKNRLLSNFGGLVSSLKELKEGNPGKWARAAGALTDSVAVELGEMSLPQKAVQKTINTVLAPLGWTEKFNRIWSSNVGKIDAMADFDDLVSTGLKQGLLKESKKGGYFPTAKGRKALESIDGFNKLKESWGVKNPVAALKRGFLTEEELKYASYLNTQETQFGTLPWKRPPSWNTETGKTFTLFKNFIFQQGKFVKDEVAKEAVKGNPIPALKFVVAAATIGESFGSLRESVKSGFTKAPYEDLIKSVKHLQETGEWTPLLEHEVDNILTIGGFGLYTEALQSVIYGKESWLSNLAGPAVKDVADVSYNLLYPLGVAAKTKDTEQAKTAAAKSGRALKKKFVRDIPFVGPPLLSRLKKSEKEEKSSKKPFAPVRKSTSKKKKPFG